MKDLKELTSLIELLSVNDGSSYYAQLEAGDFVLVLGRMPYSNNTFCKVLSNFGSKQGDIISVKPSDIRCKVTLDDVLTEILPTEKKEEPSIPTPLIGEFALTEAGNVVLVKEQATPDTFTCEVIIPRKDSLHRVGGTIRMRINKMHLVSSSRVAEIIKESIHNPEKPEYSKGDIVELKDDYSAIYRLGYAKNPEVYHSMKYSATNVEGVSTISVSKCEVPLQSIKCIANGKRVNDMRRALTSVIGLL